MVQLRHDYQKFQDADAEVIVIVPNGPERIQRLIAATGITYPILADIGSQVADQYGIQTKKLGFGPVPAFLTPERVPGGRFGGDPLRQLSKNLISRNRIITNRSRF